MKKLLLYDLMQFAYSKKNTKEKVKYVFLGIVFFFFLSNTLSAKGKGNSSASEVATGDDVYPLF